MQNKNAAAAATARQAGLRIAYKVHNSDVVHKLTSLWRDLLEGVPPRELLEMASRLYGFAAASEAIVDLSHAPHRYQYMSDRFLFLALVRNRRQREIMNAEEQSNG